MIAGDEGAGDSLTTGTDAEGSLMNPDPRNMTMQRRVPPDEARARFPRGLAQPEGSYRFAVDSLLLSAFIPPREGSMLLDIGAGCGVVGLAALCAYPGISVFGVEREPELAGAARNNREVLGFQKQLRVVEADIGSRELFISGPGSRGEKGLPEAAFDVVLANPPFRQADKGRVPPSPLRARALFEKVDTLTLFCRCAARALRPEGRFGILYDASREYFLLEELEEAGLAPVRLLPVRALPGKEPFRILVEACLRPLSRGAIPVQRRDPLTIYDKNGRPGEEAMRFCPFLAG